MFTHDSTRLHGTFRPETLTVEARGSSLSAAAQRQLALATCCQAFGIEPPTAEMPVEEVIHLLASMRDPACTPQPVRLERLFDSYPSITPEEVARVSGSYTGAFLAGAALAKGGRRPRLRSA